MFLLLDNCMVLIIRKIWEKLFFLPNNVFILKYANMQIKFYLKIKISLEI